MIYVAFRNKSEETNQISISRGCSVLGLKRSGYNKRVMKWFHKFKLIDLAENDILNIIQLTKKNMVPIIKIAWGLEWDINFEKKYLEKLLSIGIVKTVYGGNKFVGYFWFTEREEENDIFIYSMQLKKEYQNKGIGTQILNWIESFALNHNRQYLSLFVQINNQKAIDLYLRFGFHEIFGEQISIYMRKKLNLNNYTPQQSRLSDN